MLDTLLKTDDSFVMRVLSNDLTFANTLGIYSSASQSTGYSANAHNASVNDTLVTLTAGSNTLTFLKASGRVLVTHINIETNTLTIDNDVHVGVAKSVFEQKFSISQIPDILVISDLEGGNTFTFLFDNSGILIRIKYQVAFVE